ncbi:threonine--tRNA ligase [Candidatus Woesearchaeota archaeon]|jgi:threonyl-tRNA synthetase|nr:threonine--tRNA ligase [Candidatus Woesearchaeota archaeon]
MVKITFPDGNIKEYEKVCGLDIARGISPGLEQAALAVKANDKLLDLTTTITTDSKIQIITFRDSEGVEIFQHSATHLLMHALSRLYGAIPGIGPAIESGYYHDFDCETQINIDNLPEIEQEMKKIVKERIEIKKIVKPIEEAVDFLKKKGYKYTLELVEELKEKGETEVSFYEQGDFINMCKGPHVPNTSKLKASKLTKIAGAYWRGDAKNKQLQRIYGISFPDKKPLKEKLRQIEEAEKNDHNKVGRQMSLFTTSDIIGQGLPLMMPKGSKILQILQRWIEDEEESRGYLLTKTPVMAKSELYKVSGHWEHYKDGMFQITNDGDILALRPMTCPFQFIIYNAESRSYRDLPIRYNETSPLFRKEESGEMHGLTRIRQFTLSEGHIVCRPDQLEHEFKEVVDLVNYIMKTLKIDDIIWYRFSKWDPNKEGGKYIDNPKAWEGSQKAMKKILDDLNLDYVEAEGEAAFYGPKLDIQTKNVYGKEDTLITIQIDFALPERFDMTYVDTDGVKKRPMIVHRSSIGCYERTLALLIEHYKGKFPLWLNPNQVKILTVADRHIDYAKKLKEEFNKNKVRVEIDERSESIPKKVRAAQLDQFNYILVVGDKEQESHTVNIRTRDNVVHGEKPVIEFIEQILKEIDERL